MALGVAVLKMDSILSKCVCVVVEESYSDRKQKDGPEDIERLFACATVWYSTDVIYFRNCCRDVSVYCALCTSNVEVMPGPEWEVCIASFQTSHSGPL